jgi:hypothetical protein
MARRSIKDRLSQAAMAGLGVAGKDTTPAKADALVKDLELLGISAVSFNSSAEELAEYSDRMWEDQNDPIQDRMKEWTQIEKYVANEQFLAYHRGRGEWIPRKTVPWRVRASYNICSKCVELRVMRLTENKPTITVQAATVDMSDVEKAEYKEQLFWALWSKLSLHKRVTAVRHLATLNGCGILKVGWDPDAGVEIPRTRKQLKYIDVEVPVPDPLTGQPMLDAMGQPVTQPQKQFAGVEEVYLDPEGNELGPVEIEVEDEDHPGEKRKVRAPVPEGCEQLNEGEVFVDVRRAASIRWDRYVDDIDESYYVQDTEILPGAKIVAMFPDALELLQEAKPASEQEKLAFGSSLVSRDPTAAGASDRSSRVSESSSQLGELNKEYVVRETWLYPLDSVQKKLWGKDGCKLVTVGGVLVHKSSLPEWAKRKRNFVRFLDLEEVGNHYGKSIMRDILPLQDDINRSRSMMAERTALESRLIIGAPQNHGLNIKALGGMPGVLMTYRSKDHQPASLNLTQQGPGADSFYRSSLEAAHDVGDMNDASRGKLPSAGLAGKAIYALQYADERSVAKTSTLQDESLKKLAMAMDAVTRVEYKDARKIRMVGEDRSFLIETEITPEHLDTDIDYFFTPGSMLSKQKEAVRNEMIQLRDAQLIDNATARKFISTAVPDVFRQSNDLQEAKARRNLSAILRQGKTIQADPWDDPTVAIGVLTEYMLSHKWQVTGDAEKQMIAQLWQSYKLMLAPPPPDPNAPAQPGQPSPQPGQPAPAPSSHDPENSPMAKGARGLEGRAARHMKPPPAHAAAH